MDRRVECFYQSNFLKSYKTHSQMLGKVESGGGPIFKVVPKNKKSPRNESLNCDLLKFLNRYGIFWVPPGESSCPDGSEYVWQRGVESL